MDCVHSEVSAVSVEWYDPSTPVDERHLETRCDVFLFGVSVAV